MDRTPQRLQLRSDGVDQRTAIIVCGMHRSGTSAVTRVLSLLGATLPENIYPAGPGNETGFWEPAEAIQLNDEMLQSAGSHVNALWDSDSDWFESQAVRRFKSKIKQLIAAEYSDQPLFVIKDPRISLLLPVWNAALDELGIGRHVVVCYRNPLEVAQSMRHRQTSFFPHECWDLDRGGLLWLRYMCAAERHSRGSSRAFCDYADLLSDWRGTVRWLGATFAIDWPRWSVSVENEVDSFLSSSLRHHEAHEPVSSLGRAWQDWIEPVHQELLKSRRGSQVDPAVFDTAGAGFRSAMRVLGRHLAGSDDRNAELGSEIGSLRSQIAAQQGDLARRDGELAKAAELHAAAREELASSITQANAQAEAYRSQLQAVERTAEMHAAASEEFARSLEQANGQAEAYHSQLQAMEKTAEMHAAAREELARDIEQVNAQAEAYRSRLQAMERTAEMHVATQDELVRGIEQANTQDEAYRAQLQSLEKTVETLTVHAAETRNALEVARAEAANSGVQRDIARVALRRAAAAAEGAWRERVAMAERDGVAWRERALEAERDGGAWRERALEAERDGGAWRERALAAERDAVAWRERYEGLRARLEAILRRYWILAAGRLVPASARRFVRQRLLGPAHHGLAR
jgi:hypothetical protein